MMNSQIWELSSETLLKIYMMAKSLPYWWVCPDFMYKNHLLYNLHGGQKLVDCLLVSFAHLELIIALYKVQLLALINQP